MMTSEKLERKYGDPYLKQLAEKTDAAKNYYELYLNCQREKYWSEIESLIAYVVAFLFIIVSAFTAPYFGIPGVAFLCFAVQCSCNARIESLWGMRFAEGVFEAERVHKVQEAVEKIKESRNVFEAVAKEGKK